MKLSSQKLHIKSDSTHKQVNIPESLTRHVSWQRLALRNCFHNTIPNKKAVSIPNNPNPEVGITLT